jgi:RHS repeat-associated protein
MLTGFSVTRARANSVRFGAALVLWAIATPVVLAATPWSTQTHDLYKGDFNGDGREDVLYVAKSIADASGIAASDASGPHQNLNSWSGTYLGVPWYDNLYRPVVGDFNGDGKADILMHRQSPGNHFVLLNDGTGNFSVQQNVADSYLGQVWNGTAHRIVAGDFNGDNRDDLFLQAATPQQSSAVMLANASGQFTSSDQTWGDVFLGFNWSVTKALVHVGDFNGDNRDDLFVQAKPDWMLIDYEVPFPVPRMRPGSFGVALARAPSGGQYFYSPVAQFWNADHQSGKWSTLHSNIIVGDFDGDGKADLFLQSRGAGRPNQLFLANTSGTGQFTASNAIQSTLVANATADQGRLMALRTATGGASALYNQATSSAGNNQVLQNVSQSNAYATGHDPNLMNIVTPGTATGSVPGEFSVDPTGGADYRIPIAVPPGVAGLAPELSLVYSSRGGNGLLGVGFSISGMSGVTRCPTNFEVDGFTDGADFDGNDAFCLDGQRLIVHTGTNGSIGAEYRTELETFQRVLSIGGTAGDPAKFEVWDKAGLIREYGRVGTGLDDAKFLARKAGGVTGQGVVWAVRRIRDRFGNFIEYTYDQSQNALDFWPISIEYGSQYNNGSRAVVGRVLFDYPATRDDSSSGFMVGGWQTSLTKRLRKLTVFGRFNATVAGAPDKVREYYLNYELSPVSGQSHVKEVVMCDGAATTLAQRCVGSTKFQWQHGYRGFAEQYTTANMPKRKHMQYMKPADMNGDGRIDYIGNKFDNNVWHVRLTELKTWPETGFNYGLSYADRSITMDWNNDGLSDLVQAYGSSANPYFQVLLGSSTSTGGTAGWGASINSTVSAKGLSVGSEGTVVGDFNGDGAQDIAFLADGTDWASQYGRTLRLQLNTGTASGGLGSSTIDATMSGSGRAEEGSAVRIINFDNDGRDDLLVKVYHEYTIPSNCEFNGYYYPCDYPMQAIQYHVYSLNDAGALTRRWPAANDNTQYDWRKLRIVDTNGDGLTDILHQDANSNGWRLRLGTGDPANTWSESTNSWFAQSYTVPICYEDWTYFESNNYGQQNCGTQTVSLTEQLLDDALVFDYNRDGRTDVMLAHSGTWYVLPASGAGFEAELWNTGRTALEPGSAMIVDDRADGIPDLIFPTGASEESVYAIYYGRGPVAGVVEKITDGLGAETTVQTVALTALDPSTNAPIAYKGHADFVEGAAPVFPYGHLGAAIPVVYQFAADNGLMDGSGNKGRVRTSYEYRGLKTHRQGRGMLGFSEVRSWNDNSEIETRNRMFQQYPLTGMVVTSEQKFRDQGAHLASLGAWVGDSGLILNYNATCETNPLCSAISPGAGAYAPAATLTVTFTTNTANHLLQTLPSGGRTYFPYVRTSTADLYATPNGTPSATKLKTTRTEYLSSTAQTGTNDPYNAYDNFGNPYVIRVTTTNGAAPGSGVAGDEHRVTTVNAYTNFDGSEWCLGRLNSTTVTHQKPGTNSTTNTYGDLTETRTASFTYQSGSQCVLQSETAQPGSATRALTKTYVYDIYGNRYQETTTGANVPFGQERVSGAIASSGGSSYVATQGQFPTRTRNALGHAETSVWDGRYAIARTVTGPNGFTAQVDYDSFGRKLRETPNTAVPAVYSDTAYFWCASTGLCADSRSVYVIRSASSDGSQSFTEFDRLGRQIATRTLNFEGEWTHARRYFDPLGREYLSTDPFKANDSPCWNFQRFDALGRPIFAWSSFAGSDCSWTIPAYTATVGSGLSATGRQMTTEYDLVPATGSGANGVTVRTVENSSDTTGYATARVSLKTTNVMGRTRFVMESPTSPTGCPADGSVLTTNTSTCYVTEYDYDATGNLTYTKQNGALGAGASTVTRTIETKVSFDERGFKMLMIDPDMGQWSYDYNTFGELTFQRDAKNQETQLSYDRLGRLVQRTEKSDATVTEQTSFWVYDTAPRGIGKLDNVRIQNASNTVTYQEWSTYDPMGRLSRVQRNLGGTWFYVDQAYDALGRVDTIKYPGAVAGDSSGGPEADANRLIVRQNYNAFGYLASVQDAVTNTTYWRADEVDESGRVTRETLGNSLVTRRLFDRASGALNALQTGTTTNATSIQNLTMIFDQAGNLRERRDSSTGVNSGNGIRETYGYDRLYRMTSMTQYKPASGSTVSTSQSYSYDHFGNLRSKGGAGAQYSNYKYDSGCSGVVRPHAVHTVAVGTQNRTYCYDPNGNVTSATVNTGSMRWNAVTWSVANLAVRVQSSGTNYTEFTYGPDRVRYRQHRQRTATDTETTLYAGGLYERLTKVSGSTTTIENTHYIRAGDQVVVVSKRTKVGIGAMGAHVPRYLHRDHLGSIVTTSDAGGAQLERSGFDPWGKRTDFSTWNPPAPNTFVPGGSGSGGNTSKVVSTKRGYTGHEHVDELGFVHMNGRIYDPELGRFFSADPTMQFPLSTQGFNRYAYAGNNPLTNVDPSGFSFWKKLMKFAGIVMSFFKWANPFLQILWTFASGFLASGGQVKGGLLAVLNLGLNYAFGLTFSGRLALPGGGGAGGKKGGLKFSFDSAAPRDNPQGGGNGPSTWDIVKAAVTAFTSNDGEGSANRTSATTTRTTANGGTTASADATRATSRAWDVMNAVDAVPDALKARATPETTAIVEGDAHLYGVRTKICESGEAKCTEAEVYQYMLNVNPTPGSTVRRATNGGRDELDFGVGKDPIQYELYPRQYAIRRTTFPSHRLHPGDTFSAVERVSDANGGYTLYVQTYGTGYVSRPYLGPRINNVIGIKVFSDYGLSVAIGIGSRAGQMYEESYRAGTSGW